MRVQGPRSNEIEQSYGDKSHKLDPTRPLDEGPRPKSGEFRLNLRGCTILEGKSIDSNQNE
jgi:hypothetical protein